MGALRFCVEEGGERLDVFLAGATGFSRSKIKKLLDSGKVLLNGEIVKGGTVVRADDSVSLDVEPEIEGIVPQDIPLNIIYEDEDIIVINKQCGLVVHPGGGAQSGTLANALAHHFTQLSSVDAARPGIVHRLDKDTSGVMVAAKNDAAHISLSKQIGEKTAIRTYLGLCEGNVKEDSGRIETNIVRHKQKRKEFVVCGEGEGRRAITTFRVLKRFEGFTLVEFRLYTGRTHQIRVHAKHIKHPIVCDKTYGFSKPRFAHEGQLLHSHSLELTQPSTGKRLTFKAPLPDYFTKILNTLKEI